MKTYAIQIGVKGVLNADKGVLAQTDIKGVLYTD